MTFSTVIVALAHATIRADTPKPNPRMLVIEPESSLSTQYRVVVDGDLVARVVETRGPAHGVLDIDGARHRIGGPVGGPVAAISIVQALFGAITGRRIYSLDDPAGRLLAKVRAHGWHRNRYDVQVGGLPSAMWWDAAIDGYRWRFIGGGDGTIRATPGRTRSVTADLPSPMLSLPVQAFLALIALQQWEYLSRGD